MLSHRRPWRSVWVESAYGGPEAQSPGYWRTESPTDHFRTAATSTSLLSQLVLGVLDERPWIRAVVDLGAGTGALANAVVDARRDLDVYAVDLRDRPSGLDDDVAWCRDLWDVDADRWTSGEAEVVLATLDRPTLILAVEWLDDLPCTIATRDADGVVRQVEVDPNGVEGAGATLSGEGAGAPEGDDDRVGAPDDDDRVGAPVSDDEADWTGQWWATGPRIEVGLTRDRAWADALRRLRTCGGAGLVIDYGHLASNRPGLGSLAAYARGERRPVRPSPELNLTAHVAVDSLRAAGQDVGARTVEMCTLAAVVADRPVADHPDADHSGAHHPGEFTADPLAALVQRGERAALSSDGVWGAQHWLLQEIAPPSLTGPPAASTAGAEASGRPTYPRATVLD